MPTFFFKRKLKTVQHCNARVKYKVYTRNSHNLEESAKGLLFSISTFWLKIKIKRKKKPKQEWKRASQFLQWFTDETDFMSMGC